MVSMLKFVSAVLCVVMMLFAMARGVSRHARYVDEIERSGERAMYANDAAWADLNSITLWFVLAVVCVAACAEEGRKPVRFRNGTTPAGSCDVTVVYEDRWTRTQREAPNGEHYGAIRRVTKEKEGSG